MEAANPAEPVQSVPTQKRQKTGTEWMQKLGRENPQAGAAVRAIVSYRTIVSKSR